MRTMKCKECGYGIEVDQDMSLGHCPSCGAPFLVRDVNYIPRETVAGKSEAALRKAERKTQKAQARYEAATARYEHAQEELARTQKQQLATEHLLTSPTRESAMTGTVITPPKPASRQKQANVRAARESLKAAPGKTGPTTKIYPVKIPGEPTWLMVVKTIRDLAFWILSGFLLLAALGSMDYNPAEALLLFVEAFLICPLHRLAPGYEKLPAWVRFVIPIVVFILYMVVDIS